MELQKKEQIIVKMDTRMKDDFLEVIKRKRSTISLYMRGMIADEIRNFKHSNHKENGK